jgi:hypothetical protein
VHTLWDYVKIGQLEIDKGEQGWGMKFRAF